MFLTCVSNDKNQFVDFFLGSYLPAEIFTAHAPHAPQADTLSTTNDSVVV